MIDIANLENDLAHLQQTVDFGDRFEILMSSRRPDFQSPGTLAVEARSKSGPGRRFFALVCQKKYPPRQDIMRLASRIARLGVVTPVDGGAILFPEDGIFRYVIIFEEPNGRKLLTPDYPDIPKLKEDDILHGFVSRVVNFFRECSQRSIAHRAIRADNIYIDEAGLVTLGEFVSTPAGLFQPALYEPIDLGQCSPIGKGPGTHDDDFYSFGVIMAQFAMGGTLCDGLSEEDVVARKLKHGSYGALIGQNRIPLRLMEPLRGLLSDNAADRWGLEDLEFWMSGRQQSPKLAGLPPKAVRYFKFNGKEHWTARSLAYGFSRSWQDAKDLVNENNELENWVKRALLNEDMGNQVRNSVNVSAVYAGMGDIADRGLASVLISMDNNAPIHYRDLSLRFNGVIHTLGLAVSSGDDQSVKDVIEVIKMKLAHQWLSFRKNVGLDSISALKSLDHMETTLEKDFPGYGMPRAIYDGCDGMPCLSPLLGENYCADLASLLAILEQQAKAGALDGIPVDEHILAFISKNLKGSHDKTLRQMLSDDFITVVRSYLRLLGHAQSAHGNMSYPNLTAYFANLLLEQIEQFKNTYFRDEMRKALDIVSEKGDLDNLGYLLDNPKFEAQDKMGFETAQQVYSGLHAQIKWLHEGGWQTSDHVRDTAGRAAAIVSAVLSMLALMFMTLGMVL
ncbi:serine/threonine-protein kinase [Kiloniella sp. b19]|uniref:serine/threonine-protein kinase n=1 Tax=Kiloniella sp. GXU_MW_B19 TaxID=3141326 RepID=UPI0031DC52A8